MAVDILLKMEPVKGESKVDGHHGEIDIIQWSWGASQSGTTHMGGGGGAGKVSVRDLQITKYIDKATTGLVNAVCTGKHFDKALLIVRKASGDKQKPVEYLKVEMSEVIITDYGTGGHGGEDRFTETVQLNFAKVKVEYTVQSDKGAADGSDSFTYDIKQRKGE